MPSLNPLPKLLNWLAGVAGRPKPRLRLKSQLLPDAERLEDRALLSAAPTVVSLELQNDTGTPDDNITTDATLTGTVTDDVSASGVMVEIDLDNDGILDQTTYTDANGVFSYDAGQDLSYGENTIRARALEWDDSISDFIAGMWESVTFDYQPPPNNPADPGNMQVDGDGILTGTITNDGSVSGVMIELDYDGDGYYDQYTYTDSNGDFSHDVGGDVGYGQHTIYVRAVEWDNNIQDYVYGTWESVSFDHQPPPNDPADPGNMQVDGDGILTGTITNDGSVSGVMIELDYNGDGYYDQYTYTDTNGDFSYDVGADVGYGQHTIYVRAVEWDSNIQDYVYGTWESVSFDHQPPPNDPAVVVSADVDEVGILTGTITNDGSVSGVMIELDYDGDGYYDHSTYTDGNGEFSYDIGTDVGYGQHTIYVRAVEWDDNIQDYVYGDWESVSFNIVAPNEAPDITDFTWHLEAGNLYVFEGTVTNDDSYSLTITFGGVLSGHSVQVQGDTFYYSIQLPANSTGLVTAQTTDHYGLQSNVATEYLI